MKSYVLTLAILAFAYIGLIAQSDPISTINYQGVLRDATDGVISDWPINVRLSVLDGPGGNALYIEEHPTVTSSLGLFSLEVGAGKTIGGSLDWMDIPWGAGRNYLKVEVDITGGLGFEVLGESPILAVPIAVQANQAGEVVIEDQMGEIIGEMSELNGRSHVDVDNIDAESIHTSGLSLTDEEEKIIAEFFADDGKSNIRVDNVDADNMKAEGIRWALDNGPNLAELNIVDGKSNLRVDNVDAVNIDAESVQTTGLSILDEIGTNLAELSIDDGKSILRVDNANANEIDATVIRTRNLFFQDLEVLGDNLFIETNDINVVGPSGDPFLHINPSATSNDFGMTLHRDMRVYGGVIANFKSFLIDHPLDPENKNLRHFSIESDKLVNIYSGTVTLDENGEAWVQLPEWFEALNTDFSYQLTCIGGFSNVYIGEKIDQNRFKIAGGTKDLEVSWQVNGVRHDKQALELNLPIEELKLKSSY